MIGSNVPQQITWNATGSTADSPQKAKAIFLAFWDAQDKSALRIDLWTKDMMIDEMADFYFQVFNTMADTFERATKHSELVQRHKKICREFSCKIYRA